MNIKITYFILGLSILGIIVFWIYNSKAPNNTNIEEMLQKIEYKLDSIQNKKDSIKSVIDSTHIKIITNEKHYLEKIHTINTQSSSADSSFIIDYIKQCSIKATMPDTIRTREII